MFDVDTFCVRDVYSSMEEFNSSDKSGFSDGDFIWIKNDALYFLKISGGHSPHRSIVVEREEDAEYIGGHTCCVVFDTPHSNRRLYLNRG